MVILITVATHTGKTMLAQRMLERYGYPYLSMDHLKMGLIRSGQTKLTPADDDELTAYLLRQADAHALVCARGRAGLNGTRIYTAEDLCQSPEAAGWQPECFGTKVALSVNDSGKGKISISFSNEEELERIVSILDRLKH